MDPADAIRDDSEHGADELARKAVEALLRAPSMELAGRLMGARPGMPVVANRVAGAWQAHASGHGDGFLRLLAREGESIRNHTAGLVRPPLVTISRSSTVASAIEAGPVWVLESRPGGEGRTMAAGLQERGIDADWCADDDVGEAVDGARCALLGCDALLRDGTVWNKVGSSRLARAARRAGARVFVVTSTAKAAPGLEASRLWELSRPRGWFETVDPSLVDAYITEQGVLGPTEIGAWVGHWAAIRGAVEGGSHDRG